MLKTLKNQAGFTGLIGLIVAIVVIGIMSAMLVPTFTAKMNYKQAKYTVGVIKTIENAENAYMAKNNSFADLTQLAGQGYLSSNFLESVQGGSYPQPNWVSAQIANQTINICIDNGSGCPNNPNVGNNGYFVGIYNIPANFQTYVEHELPGSGASGTQDVSYVAPIPSSPPVANANYANSAGNANYANTAGYANSSGLPGWSQEANSLVGTYYGGAYNPTNNTLFIQYMNCSAHGNSITVTPTFAFIPPGGSMPSIYHPYYGHYADSCLFIYYNNYVISAYSG